MSLGLGRSAEVRYALDLTIPYNNLLAIKGAQDQSFIWGNGLISASGDESFNYLTDHLGSPIRLLDNSDSSTVLAYDEFGVPTVDAGSGLHNPFGFTGYQADDISGMYYAQARYYAPQAGRFISEDIVKGRNVLPKSLNTYDYCCSQSLTFDDKDGMDMRCCCTAMAWAPHRNTPAPSSQQSTGVSRIRVNAEAIASAATDAANTARNKILAPTLDNRVVQPQEIICSRGSDWVMQGDVPSLSERLSGAGDVAIRAGEIFFGAGETIVQGMIDLDLAVGSAVNQAVSDYRRWFDDAINPWLNRIPFFQPIGYTALGVYYITKGVKVAAGGVALIYGTGGIASPIGLPAVAYGSYFWSSGTRYLVDGISKFIDEIVGLRTSETEDDCPTNN